MVICHNLVKITQSYFAFLQTGFEENEAYKFIVNYPLNSFSDVLPIDLLNVPYTPLCPAQRTVGLHCYTTDKTGNYMEMLTI